MAVFKVDEKFSDHRLDKYLYSIIKKDGLSTGEIPESFVKSISRTQFVDQFKKVGGLVNGKKVTKPGFKVSEGDEIEVDLVKLLSAAYNKSLKYDSENITAQNPGKILTTVYENSDFMVLDKPAGVVMHPGVGNPDHTLANYIKGYLSGKGEYDPTVKRAGIVHRLDKEVSGLVIIAKNRETQLYLKELFENREVIKIYRAKVDRIEDTRHYEKVRESLNNNRNFEKDELLEILKDRRRLEGAEGVIKMEGYVGRDVRARKKMRFMPMKSDKLVAPRKALSYLLPVSIDDFFIRIITGRMHQIRVTFRYLGYQVVGDSMYGNSSSNNDRIELESVLLEFRDENGKIKVFSKL
jgi:23S rRNA pseudouridine1911/1915/1917 synthase